MKGNKFAVTDISSKEGGFQQEVSDEDFKKKLLNDIKPINSEDSDDEDNSDEFYKKKMNDGIKARLQDLSCDYARGAGLLFSDSSSDESLTEGEIYFMLVSIIYISLRI